MNEELREEIIEDSGLKWCAVINDYVHRDCFNHCSECSDVLNLKKDIFLLKLHDIFFVGFAIAVILGLLRYFAEKLGDFIPIIF